MRVPWTAKRSNQSILKEINSEYSLDGLMLKLTAAAESLQSCPTLCDSIDGSPPGSPVPGILQARVLEWGAIAFSKIQATTAINLKVSITRKTIQREKQPS